MSMFKVPTRLPQVDENNTNSPGTHSSSAGFIYLPSSPPGMLAHGGGLAKSRSASTWHLKMNNKTVS